MKRLAYLLLFISILGQAYPQAGSLDNTFNDDGIALYHMGNGRGVVSFSDNSMIIMGDTEINGLAGCYLMKLNEDSSIDPTWGVNGMVEFQIGTNGTYPYNIERVDGGKLLVSGMVYVSGYDGEFFVAKFNINDGSLDTGFNGTGYSITDYSDDEEVCQAMVIQPDGKIVLGGRTLSGLFSQLLFVRFNSDGTIDSSFGISGYTEINASTQDESILGIDILSNGTIVGVGYGFHEDPYWTALVCMAKLDSGGQPITSFGGNGVITPSLFNASSYAWDVHVFKDSLFLTGNLYNSSDDKELYLAKFDSSGVAVANFATDGIHKLNLNASNTGFEIMTASDQKIYVAGTTGPGGLGDSQFLLTRFLADGNLDTSFDNDGYATTDIRVDWDEAFTMAMQDDGKILLTGMSGGLNSNGQNEVPVVRYLNDFVPFYVEFTSDMTTVCVDGSVNFVDESSNNVTEWNWSFEGGTPATSTNQNPEITYNTLGTFDVQLIVEYENASIDTITKEDYVNVVDLTVAPDEPVGEIAPCNGSFHEYTANPVPTATYYEWEITPAAAGTIPSDSETATLIPTDGWTGDFTIRVRGGNVCGYGDWSDGLEGSMYETPDEYEIEGGGSYCIGGDGVEVTLSGSEVGVDYELYLNDETTGIIVAGTGSEISFGLQTSEGGYTATGFNTDCQEYMLNQIMVEILFPPVEPATPTGPTLICNEETSTYSSEGSDDSDSYLWTLSPEEAGTISTNGLEATVTWNMEFTGAAMISLYGINDCGEGETSEALEVSVGAPNPIVEGEELVCDFSDEIYTVADNDGSTYAWVVTGGLISEGQGTNMITVSWTGEGIGTITVDEETAGGCSGSSDQFDVLIDDCTGINDKSDENSLTIYPNPAKDFINISFKSNSTSSVVSVYDITGQLTLEKQFQTNNGGQQLNVSNLISGIYLIRVQSGGKVLTSKLFMKN